MESLGKKLKEARLARNLTLEEACRLTKIRPGRLEEIENEDFSQFASLAYARGFLIIYGKFLEVDVAPYLEAFETAEEITVDGYDYLQDTPFVYKQSFFSDMSASKPSFATVIRKHVNARDFRGLQRLLGDCSAADVRHAFPELSGEEQVLVFRLLPREIGIDIFRSLNVDERRKFNSPPHSIVDFDDVLELSLYNNKLRSIPESIGILRRLRRLSLDANELITLPESLGQLRDLRELYLDSNHLVMLPECLARLRQLRVLSVVDNRLKVLPGWLTKLTHLEQLYLHGNPGLGLPEEILGPKKGAFQGELSPALPAHILRYYLRIHPAVRFTGKIGSKPLLEARIIVIGDGAAGKTSLVRQLLYDLPAREEEAGTRDVVIEEWPITLKGQQVVANLWDFGGQNRMHAAHPYFFTTRTLYLLVVEARKDQEDRVDYWLKMVAKYGDTARALVVVNKNEDHAMALDRPKLLDKYRRNLPEDSSQAFFSTSCKKGTGISRLRAAVQHELEMMEQIWVLWPAEWFRVKEFIRQLRQPKRKCPPWLQRLLNYFPAYRQRDGRQMDTLNYDEWRSICNDCGVEDEKDRDQLLENLGHLGQVVCFPYDPRLRHLGVLNPEWVTRGIYPLLVENKLGAKGGMVTLDDLSELLPRDRYPKERHAWLVDLMKSFELIFEDDGGRLLLPGQLPADSPGWAQPEHWTGDDILHLELRYDVLPESVISRFIVRRHREARKRGEWWRHGIALKRGECEALVRAHVTEQEAKIELRLRGPRSQRHELLTSIRESLRDPKDSSPPDIHIILGRDCAPKYSELVIHAKRRRELDFVIDGRSITLPLAPILDMMEAPTEQDSSAQLPHLQVNIKNENTPDMSRHENKKIDIRGSDLSNVAIGIDQVLVNSLTSIQAIPDGNLKSALLTLHTQVARALEHPDFESNETVKDDLANFTKEAVRKKPRRDQLQVSGKGLIEAAKTVGAIAQPIVATVKQVLDLLTAGGSDG